MVHSRFSTNTNPSWMRAHPNRFILHNGEINTIKGNTDAMLAREETISSPIMQDDMNKILPIINTSGSDSAMLDNALEFMVMNGMDLPLAVMITIPEPWENNKNISHKKRDFYQYYATMLEPWDGPAAILFSDGDVMGAVLDRNGLRPSRYYITKDGRMILSSEVGVLDMRPGEHSGQGSPAPRQDAAGGHRQGRSGGRREAEGVLRQPRALRRVDRPQPGAAEQT